jgi:hypothetical protein
VTPEEERTVRQIASDLYAIAGEKAGDIDASFVEVRRSFLTGLAGRLMALIRAPRA